MYLYCVSGKTDTDTDTTWPGSIIIVTGPRKTTLMEQTN